MEPEIKERKAVKTPGVAAVDRALAILSVFEQVEEPLTISDLARRSGLYKSTALRILDSLCRHGHVNRTADNRYELGPAVLRLGVIYQRNSRLEEKLAPVCRRLVVAGSESPSFFIRQDTNTRLCVFRLDSNHSTLDRVRRGAVLPLDKGAAGHVIRAFGDRAAGDLHDRVRARGYAASHGETSPDCAAVAAPVFNQHDDLVGALSISGPRARFTQDAMPDAITGLLDAAREISRAFGSRWSG